METYPQHFELAEETSAAAAAESPVNWKSVAIVALQGIWFLFSSRLNISNQGK